MVATAFAEEDASGLYMNAVGLFSEFVIGVVGQRTSTIPASFVISFHGMMILMNLVKISSILTVPQQSSAISVEGIVGALDSKRIRCRNCCAIVYMYTLY